MYFSHYNLLYLGVHFADESQLMVLAIYYSDTWNSAIFEEYFVLNQTALNRIGLPALIGSNTWTNSLVDMAIGGLVAQVVLSWRTEVYDSVK
ncbi:peptide transporter mtd1 [Moniliophthora roreri]|nr:peptide transporter mtd1 [Moniliophthora roreri]